MPTTTQAVQPANYPQAAPAPIAESVLAQSAANQKRVRELDKYPELSDMRKEDEEISRQLKYWADPDSGVLADASSQVKGLRERHKLAFDLRAELKAITDRRLSREELQDLERCELTIERIDSRLQQQERRVSNAKAQIATWSQCEKSFDRERFDRLKREDARRSQLMSVSTGLKAAIW